MPGAWPYTSSGYLWDYPSGYYQSAAAMAKPAMNPLAGLQGLVGGLDMMKLLKTGILGAVLWYSIPKDKNKLLKVGGITAAVYFLY